MRSGSQHRAIFNEVNLNSAQITGNVDLDATTFSGELNAYSLQVGGSLVMRSSQLNSAFRLIGARIGNNIEMGDTKFTRVTLRGTNIARNVIMEGVTLDNDLDAGALQIGASLFGSTQEHRASFKGLSLSGTKVTGSIILNAATFDGVVRADALQVGGHLTMRDATGTSPIKMNFGQINGNFDMRGAIFAELDLSGSTVIGDFRLSGPRPPYKNTFWKIKENEPGRLRLHNTRITNLMDTEDAWPEPGNLELGAFRFTHLGGFESDIESETRPRSIENSGTHREMRDRGMEFRLPERCT